MIFIKWFLSMIFISDEFLSKFVFQFVSNEFFYLKTSEVFLDTGFLLLTILLY